MRWILLGILSFLIQLGVLVGIVVLIVRFVSGKNKNTTENVGVLIRRLFVYSIMLVMLILVGIGVAGLIEAAWPGTDELTRSSSQTAVSIAFVLVALPVFVGLSLYTRRLLRDDPREQRSFGWAFYLTVALIGSLLTSMALIGAYLSGFVDQGRPDRTLLIPAVVWSGIWVGHWWVAKRRSPIRNTQIHLLLGSVVGLIWTFTGAFATIGAVLSTVYDGLFLVAVIDDGIKELLRPITVLVVGAPVWWWYWFRHARDTARTPWWLAHVLLLGVLGGVVAMISGAGVMLFGVLEWLLAGMAPSAAGHFTFLPGAVTGLLVGGAAWVYHANVLGGRVERRRTEVDRVYDYLLSGTGLVVAASGITTLIATVIKAVSGVSVASSNVDTTLAAAITMIMIGAPMWWRYWTTIQRSRIESPSVELQSIARRVYIVALFGVAAVVTVVSLIVIVFIVFEDILEGKFGSGTTGSAAVAVGLLLTAGALAWYHLAVFREDRIDVGSVDYGPVAPETATAPDVPRGSLEEALAKLAESGHDRTMVLRRADGYEVETIVE
ncbi:MAG: DUF5671 domain-containing protein [Actinomycetota bacterium]|nr:DUF5671 domain-containing protein [Actinomycetota bacterium]